MIKETNIINTTNNNIPKLDFSLEDCVLFDIETTGLSSSKHMIYLIGYGYYSDGIWHNTSLMATNLDDESQIIAEFLELLKSKKYLIHFNGSTFDIPFIKSRANFHKLKHLTSYLSELESIDLYKLAKKHSKFLNLENYKLKTIEKSIGINRKDIYSGKELIEKYYDFVKVYSLDSVTQNFSNSNKLKEVLNLHNYEDIANMIPLLNLFTYDFLLNGNFNIDSYSINDNYLNIDCLLLTKNAPYTLLKDIHLTHIDNTYHIDLNITQDRLSLTIPITKTELKFFYPDYKNYYYLPLEDNAIHKSVGMYVNKEHREQAKASTCYTKKQGCFIPTHANISTIPIFKNNFNESSIYIELNDIFLTNHIKEYVLCILNHII